VQAIMRSDAKGQENRKRLGTVFAAGLVLAICYTGLLVLSPEVGHNHIRGPVILNVSGAGYRCGDAVWLSGPRDECNPKTAVLYDWRQIDSRGFGPDLAIVAFGALDARQKEHIVAVVRCKFGYNPLRAQSYNQRVY
jgi:hypothetical protein